MIQKYLLKWEKNEFRCKCLLALTFGRQLYFCFYPKSFGQLKIFSTYHLIITLFIPLVLLIPVLNKVWTILPAKTFRILSEFLGLVFIVIGLYNINMFLKDDKEIS